MSQMCRPCTTRTAASVLSKVVKNGLNSSVLLGLHTLRCAVCIAGQLLQLAAAQYCPFPGACVTQDARTLQRPSTAKRVSRHKQHTVSRTAPCAMAAVVCSTEESSNVGSNQQEVVSTLQNFQDMMTLLGGATDSCFRGYVGQWRTWVATPTSTTNSSSTSQTNSTADKFQFQAEDINFRLFQLKSTDPPAIHQINMYQKPNKASAAYKQYLQNGQTSGRADGYTLREWDVRPVGTLWETDAPWMSGDDPSIPPQSTLVGLAVHDTSLGLFNGGLPLECDATQPWYLEVINRAPSSHDRRWGLLLRYDDCTVTNLRTIHEDLHETTQQQISQDSIDPSAFKFFPRGDRLPLDLDSWMSTHMATTGTSVTFSYNEQHKLTQLTQPCSWSSAHATQDQVMQTFPDGMYIRVPRSIAPGSAEFVIFEFGVVSR
eukprot:GHUV01048784.1.p1 GENE.GHUV01048784.1~~GHUV01048784.1.p1  ORF type:complete len:430 (+),score=82.67 GHUV01048784.1:528-1817(+)